MVDSQPSGLQSFSVKSEDSPLPNFIECNHNSYFWLTWQSSEFVSSNSCPGTYADDGIHNSIVHKRTIKYTINFSSVSGSSFPNYFFVSFCSSFFSPFCFSTSTTSTITTTTPSFPYAPILSPFSTLLSKSFILAIRADFQLHFPSV